MSEGKQTAPLEKLTEAELDDYERVAMLPEPGGATSVMADDLRRMITEIRATRRPAPAAPAELGEMAEKWLMEDAAIYDAEGSEGWTNESRRKHLTTLLHQVQRAAYLDGAAEASKYFGLDNIINPQTGQIIARPDYKNIPRLIAAALRAKAGER